MTDIDEVGRVIRDGLEALAAIEVPADSVTAPDAVLARVQQRPRSRHLPLLAAAAMFVLVVAGSLVWRSASRLDGDHNRGSGTVTEMPVHAPDSSESTQVQAPSRDARPAWAATLQPGWHELTPPPAAMVSAAQPANETVVVDGGDRVFVWTVAKPGAAVAAPVNSPSPSSVHVLDPATGLWSDLGDPKASATGPRGGVWTGETLLLWSADG
nr:hypothetical protein [Burkholderiaceae bacterium]